MHGAQVQSVGDGFGKLFLVVSDRAARAAQRERGPDHQRESQLVTETQRILGVIHQRRRRHLKPNLPAGILEPQAVLGHLNGAKRGTDHFHLIFFEDAALGKLYGQIERRLSADGREQRVGLLTRNNLREIFL